MQTRIRNASEGRGFAESRLLTHWSEVVGDDVAGIAKPVEIGYARGGMGATLTLLTTGAQAPMVEMQKEQIRARVNQCYGYNAISRVRITQTAPTGFSEGRIAFEGPDRRPKAPNPAAQKQAQEATESVGSDDLRAALARLGAHVIEKQRN